MGRTSFGYCREQLLRQMDDYICEVIGDEECWETWIAVGVPDCATDDDYAFIAEDDDEWKRICKLFGDLVNTYDK